ncbi:hypothetical protein BESB_036630 [Besnoitia besnoiti]|uniref:Uncharacterized protein n=1 Tax=Besnoitia besnoiti TaxID=94643 RepID=A0A2A9MGU9_BESBE|nr:hypothetical protein BESB_036630 [Besnoitia besnoiti]PFH37205.1 hypothetical protein BESB_036630 [Besnoitia besnoiti]
MSRTPEDCKRQDGDHEPTTPTSGERRECPTLSSGDEAAVRAATVCGDCLAVALGAATTVSLALLQAGALIADVCWRVISKSCCDSGVPNGPPRYYVPSNRVAYVYEEPLRVYVPRAASGYYSGSTNTFIPTTPYL